MKRLALLLFLLNMLLVMQSALAKKPPPPSAPQIYSLPYAVQAGEKTEVAFYEEGLGQARGLWTAYASQVTPLKEGSEAGQARYQVTAAADTAVGIYGVRLMTLIGASSLRLLMVDDLPTVMSQGKNTTPLLAKAVTLPAGIEGTGEPLLAHYYRIRVKGGQHFSAEVVASRLGSPMDPMIRLLDSAGRELAYCDDAPGAGSDCRIAYVFPSEGEYLIEVRDVNYEGGANYRYRLRLGDFPLVTCAFPLAGERGQECKFHLEGTELEKLDDLTLTLPENISRTWLKAKFPQGQGSALVPVLCSDLKEICETVPNDTPDASNKVKVPVAISGHFQKPANAHYFEFEGKKGEQLTVRAFARSIDSPATVALQLLNADSSKIAESNPAGAEEASLQATIPADGVYRIAARELAGRSGPEMFYRVEIRDIQPGFSLTADQAVVNTSIGKPAKIKVTAKRVNYDGPITLSLAGDAQDLKPLDLTIAPGKSVAEVEIVPTRQEASTNPFNIAIVGKASIEGREVIEKASTLASIKMLFPRLLAPPPELDGLIGVGALASSP